MTWSETGTSRTIRCRSRISSAGKHRLDVSAMRGRGAPGDLELLVEARVLHEDLEHEAVLLGLGQRIGPFLLDRVLRGQHEERIRQSLCRTRPTVTCRSCIASSSAACVFGGVRLISSARITLENSGPCRKRNSAAPVRAVLFDDLRAGDVGRHQVRA